MPAVKQVPRLAVVIPVGPGDAAWRELLPQLSWLPPQTQLRLVACQADDVDENALAHLPCAAAWVLSARGRAKQLNAGAADTQAPFLWFLHADTRIADAERVGAALARAQAQPQSQPQALCYFDLRFRNDGPAATVINSLGAWFRSRVLRLPFGDQGFALSRALFQRLGGFDESLPSAEDHALIWTARRAGVALQPLGVPLHTSARRYAEHGWCRTTLRHLWLTLQQARRFSRAAGNR